MIDKQTQDQAWECAPKAFRDAVKKSYNYQLATIRTLSSGFDKKEITAAVREIEAIFGSHNLTSDAEGEEMLTVSRKRVYEMYAHYDKICNDPNRPKDYIESVYEHADGVTMALEDLFGSKCMSDEAKDGSKDAPNVDSSESNVDTLTDNVDSFDDSKAELSQNPAENCDNEDLISKAELKFKLWDKVRIKPNAKDFHEGYENGYAWLDSRNKYLGKIYQVIGVGKDGDIMLNTSEVMWWSPIDLESYTEPNQTNDNMEEKELNLCEILETHIGENFFCPACGNVTLIENRCESHFKPLHFQQDNIHVHVYSNGCAYKQGLPVIYPSREAYLKYPLDAKRAWYEWQEEQIPRRWKPVKGEKYWHLNEFMNVTSSFYDDEDFDAYTKVEKTNNCFQSFELAQQAAEAVKATLEQFHKDNQQ